MSNERFVRWQSQTIAQLSVALSVFSGLSVAGFGFLLSLLQNQSFKPKGCLAIVFLAALGFFFTAAALSIVALVTRLIDFRLTAQKVRKDPSSEPLTFFGTDATGYGKATWRLFWSMLVLFSLAIILSAYVVLNVYLGSFLETAGF